MNTFYRQITLTFLLTAFLQTIVWAQQTYVEDDFEDQNLNEWLNSSDWTNFLTLPLPGNYMLKHNLTSIDAESYIAHSLNGVDVLAGEVVWQFNLKSDFGGSPSTSNDFAFVLMADQSDLSGVFNGYAVGVDRTNSNDFLELYKISNGSETTLLASAHVWADGQITGIKVTRSQSGTWELFYDTDGYFNNLVSGGTVTDTDFASSFFCGLVFDFSSTRAGKLYLDDLTITGPADITAPTIASVNSDIKNKVTLFFNEPLNQALAETVANYTLNGSATPTSAVLANSKEVTLTFGADFTDGVENTLSVANVQDLAGNAMVSTEVKFTYNKLKLSDYEVISSTKIDLFFSKELNQTSAETIANYQLSTPNENPLTASLDGTNAKLVHLEFTSAFAEDVKSTIQLNNVTDVFGNTIDPTNLDFYFHIPQPNDIIFSELFPDPTPAQGLPDAEFFEIYNASNFTITLSNWFVFQNDKNKYSLPKITLQAGQYKAFCKDTDLSEFQAIGATNMATLSSFPALTNTEGSIALYTADSVLVDFVAYTDDWYADTDKDDGGYSLEKIQLNQFCTQSENWKASTAFLGGTPGAENAVMGNVTENNPVAISAIKALSNNLLQIKFSEPVVFPELTTFSVNNSIGNPVEIEVDSSDFRTYLLRFGNVFSDKLQNTVTVSGLKDWCHTIAENLDTVFTFNLVYPTQVKVVDSKTLMIFFSENLTEAEAETPTNYTLNGNLNPLQVFVAPDFPNVVNMQFAADFVADVAQSIEIKNVKDIFSNVMNTTTLDFLYHENAPYDVVINEIMANPDAIYGLPDFEYIELYNRTAFDLDLSGWKMLVGSSEKILENAEIKANSFLILVPSTVADEFESYGQVQKVLGASDLTNSGKDLYLKDKNNQLIDEVIYSENWYQDATRDDGGFSLEKIDPNNQCGKINNWRASSATAGGTPGATNAVKNDNMDTTAPLITKIFALNDSTVQLQFSELMDTTLFYSTSNFLLSGQIGAPASFDFDRTTPNNLTLIFSKKLTDNTLYTLTIDNLTDYCGNALSETNYQFTFYMAKRNDIVFSELMVDETPVQGLPEYEYLELYNRSAHSIVMQNWTIVINGKDNYSISNVEIPSQSYIVLVANETAVEAFKAQGITSVYETMGSFSLSNTSGSVFLTDNNGQLIDALDYTDEWYNDENKDDGGFSLERIDLQNLCDGAENWRASAAFLGGTPAEPNAFQATNLSVSTPKLSEIEVVSSNSIRLRFSQYINFPDVNNFTVNNSIGAPVQIEMDSTNFLNYTLTFAQRFTDQQQNIITLNGISNWCGTAIADFDTVFTFQLIYPYQVELKSDKYVLIYFSQDVSKAAAENIDNFLLNETEKPIQCFLSATNPKVVHLYFQTAFVPDQNNSLKVMNVQDNYGNTAPEKTLQFVYHLTQPYDVVINEIMPTPEPPVGLPQTEYIELFNNTNFPLILNGWTLAIGSSEYVIENASIEPNSYLIVCNAELEQSMRPYGEVLPINGLKTLSAYSGSISLLDQNYLQVHYVSYDDDWYRDDFKAEGGWSLEQIDPKNYCGAHLNWKASENADGGTPGAENAVKSQNPNTTSINLVRAEVVDNKSIRIYFDKTYNYIQADDPNLYTVNQNVGNPAIVQAENPSYSTVLLTFDSEFQTNTDYEIVVNQNFADYSGNLIQLNTARFQLPASVIEAGNIVINEILFDPQNSGAQFIELYNHSDSTFDLSQLFLAVKNNGELDAKPLTETGYLFFPGDFLVFTENKALLQSDYYCENPHWIIQTDLPSLSSINDTVLLINAALAQIDLMLYHEDMHYALLADNEGVSLERTGFSRSSLDKSNWKSAASTVGFATPTYNNSQFYEDLSTNQSAIIQLSYEIFSPDNDGYNDYVNITLLFSESGYNTSLRIYDARGRLVKNIAENQLSGLTDIYTWDGLDDNKRKAPIGIYVVFLEYFDLNGNVMQEKKTVVLGGKI